MNTNYAVNQYQEGPKEVVVVNMNDKIASIPPQESAVTESINTKSNETASTSANDSQPTVLAN